MESINYVTLPLTFRFQPIGLGTYSFGIGVFIEFVSFVSIHKRITDYCEL